MREKEAILNELVFVLMEQREIIRYLFRVEDQDELERLNCLMRTEENLIYDLSVASYLEPVALYN